MNDCRHCDCDTARCCLCGEEKPDEHFGLTAQGLWLRCIQDVHFCWGQEDDWAREREQIRAQPKGIPLLPPVRTPSRSSGRR